MEFPEGEDSLNSTFTGNNLLYLEVDLSVYQVSVSVSGKCVCPLIFGSNSRPSFSMEGSIGRMELPVISDFSNRYGSSKAISDSEYSGSSGQVISVICPFFQIGETSLTVAITKSKRQSSNSQIQISDEENSAAQALLTKVTDTWGISPKELTLGPLPDGVTDESFEPIKFSSNSGAAKYGEYYDVRFFKLTLLTSVYVSMHGYPKGDTKKGVHYQVMVGNGERLKIKEPYFDLPLADTQDYTEFGVYYIIIQQFNPKAYNLYMNLHLQNEEVNLKKIMTIVGAVVGTIFGIFVLVAVFCICKHRR